MMSINLFWTKVSFYLFYVRMYFIAHQTMIFCSRIAYIRKEDEYKINKNIVIVWHLEKNTHKFHVHFAIMR